MGVFHRILQKAGGDEAGGVGHVYPQDGANFIGNLTHALIVPFAGIGRCAADDEFGFVLEGLALRVVIVHEAGFLVQAIGHRLVQDARCVHGRAVGEMAAHRQVQPHENIPGTQHCHDYGHVCLRARMGLHVRIFRVEKLAEAVYRQLLYLVYHLAAAIIAFAGIPFRILVRAD